MNFAAAKIPLSRNKYEGSRKYRLTDTAQKRRAALSGEIARKAHRDKITTRSAAQKKKARLNVLRIYRKNKPRGTPENKQCNVLTRDMNYIDSKYLKSTGGGKTRRRVCKMV